MWFPTILQSLSDFGTWRLRFHLLDLEESDDEELLIDASRYQNLRTNLRLSENCGYVVFDKLAALAPRKNNQ